MRNNKNILIFIVVALTLSSAFLLYRSFSSTPLKIVTSSVSTKDVVIRSQVQNLQVKINKALANVDTGGSLDKLVESKQFRELNADSVVHVEPGDHGRGNPFIPPIYGR